MERETDKKKVSVEIKELGMILLFAVFFFGSLFILCAPATGPAVVTIEKLAALVIGALAGRATAQMGREAPPKPPKP